MSAKSNSIYRRMERALAKTVLYLITLIGVIIVSYSILPLLRSSFEINLPGIGISLGTTIYIAIFAILCFFFIKFVSSALRLSGFKPETLAELIPDTTSEQARHAIRTLINLLFIIFILIGYWSFAPLLPMIPIVGSIVAPASQLVIAAILVLFFWDIGRRLSHIVDEAMTKLIYETGHGKTSHIEVKERALKMVTYFIATIGLIVVSYSSLPLISPTFNITFPSTGITLGMVILVILLAVIGLTAVRFAINAFALAGVHFEIFARMMPGITSEHYGAFKRVVIDISLMILVVVAYWVVSQLIALVPRIGSQLMVAAQTVSAAIVVLLVWDIGRILYRGLESIVERAVSRLG
ncbi:MAG: hypothetical protein H3Z52_14135 [archaeon]|nr:hypothetical protein [archaeon]